MMHILTKGLRMIQGKMSRRDRMEILDYVMVGRHDDADELTTGFVTKNEELERS